MIRPLAAIAALLGLTLAVACGGGDEGAIRGMLESQVRYLNERNVDGFMTTIASEAPGRAMTEATMRQMTSYDLRYTLEDVKVLNVQNSRGVVRVIQTTRVVGTPPKFFFGLVQFTDNRSTVEHTVIKESKGWKVLSSTVISTQPLSGSSK